MDVWVSEYAFMSCRWKCIFALFFSYFKCWKCANSVLKKTNKKKKTIININTHTQTPRERHFTSIHSSGPTSTAVAIFFLLMQFLIVTYPKLFLNAISNVRLFVNCVSFNFQTFINLLCIQYIDLYAHICPHYAIYIYI